MTSTADDADSTRADEVARIRLGASAFTSEDTLLALAADPLITVRVAVAMNSAAPPCVDQMLATDPDERVRSLLARRIANELPGLTRAEQASLRDRALETLATLVVDEAVRVRAALADALKEMPDAPRNHVIQLARDSEILVSEPILRLSPLLDAGDLLALIASPPHHQATLAIACRAGIPESVCDAIAASADTDAVRALLSNPSAQIRESTLDRLVSRAIQHSEWHEPLVRRPSLPPRAARALSTFVATHLLEVLAQRTDLEPQLAADLGHRVAARLTTAATGAPRRAGASWTGRAADAELGQGEAAVIAAARAGDAPRAAFLLAVAAGVPIALVERASALRSVKAIVSLTWKAGFTMRAAGPLQAVLARPGPATTLFPDPIGRFPLSVEEMHWQCEFLARSCG